MGPCGASCVSNFGTMSLFALQISKWSYWPLIIAKSEIQCDFYEKWTNCTFGAVPSKFWQNVTFPQTRSQNRRTGKCTKRTFLAMRRKFGKNITFEHTRSQNRRSGLKSSSSREHSAISMKSAHNARFCSLPPLANKLICYAVLSRKYEFH